MSAGSPHWLPPVFLMTTISPIPDIPYRRLKHSDITSVMFYLGVLSLFSRHCLPPLSAARGKFTH